MSLLRRKYKKSKKRRHAEIVGLKHERPFMSMVKISKQTGYSITQVRLALKRAGVATMRWAPRVANNCRECGNGCGRKKYCNPFCREKYTFFFIACGNCGKGKRVSRKYAEYRYKIGLNTTNYFCDRACWKTWKHMNKKGT